MTHAEVEAVLVFDKKKPSLSLRRNKRGIIYLTLQVRISFNQDLSEAGPSLARGLQSLSGRVLPTSPQKRVLLITPTTRTTMTQNRLPIRVKAVAMTRRFRPSRRRRKRKS